MVYLPNTTVKPKVLVDAAVDALGDTAVASNLVTKQGFEKFLGVEGDTISMRVKGTLPVREYGFRNDRSQPIVTDTIKDTVVNVKIDLTHNYSALKLIDEDKLFDFDGSWGDLFARQIEALTNYNEFKVINQIHNAPVEYLGIVDVTAASIKEETEKHRDPIFNAIVDAKAAIKKMRTPEASFTCLCGSNFAAELIKSNRLVFAEGDGSALSTATLGSIAGVTFVESNIIPEDEAYIFAKSGFVLYNAAPPAPTSAPYTASASAGGFALRWIMDYDTSFLTDRSVYDTYVGYDYTKDYIQVQNAQGQSFHSGMFEDAPYFTRGIKLFLKTDDNEGKDASGNVVEAFEPGDGKALNEKGNPTAGSKEGSFLDLAFHNKLTELTHYTDKTQLFPGVLEVPGVMPIGS
ncbi:hypothetical protein [Brevibacterium moorei]|uniref:hypothetical protein n=1 Tax=Brevibacterium moorei TaxID=2968457 RepID=UPI00211B7D74|nr:hypothetical protein [Brevibacterium sp. 68QC2CO]MCQ9385122.1 hypothetical protein [Brevibacterium sp. 68QC2CO]